MYIIYLWESLLLANDSKDIYYFRNNKRTCVIYLCFCADALLGFFTMNIITTAQPITENIFSSQILLQVTLIQSMICM